MDSLRKFAPASPVPLGPHLRLQRTPRALNPAMLPRLSANADPGRESRFGLQSQKMRRGAEGSFGRGPPLGRAPRPQNAPLNLCFQVRENVNFENKSFSGRNVWTQNYWRSFGNSFFWNQNREMLREIFRSPASLGESFGKDFGRPNSRPKEFPGRMAPLMAPRGPFAPTNLISAPRGAPALLQKRGHPGFEPGGPRAAQAPPGSFKNRGPRNHQLNEAVALGAQVCLGTQGKGAGLPSGNPGTAFEARRREARGPFPREQSCRLERPRASKKSTIFGAKPLTGHLSVAPVEIMSPGFRASHGGTGFSRPGTAAQGKSPQNGTASQRKHAPAEGACPAQGLRQEPRRGSQLSTSMGESLSGAQEQRKTSILQAREEKLARDYGVGLLKLESRRLNQRKCKAELKGGFEQIESLDLEKDLLVRPEPSGKLFARRGKEFMVQCRGCRCVVARVDTARRNFFISTGDSRDIFANFQMANVSAAVAKGEAYPLENLKKVLVHMLLRRPIQPQMLDLNIFEIKLLHAVLVKRFKGFYLNSKIKLKKSHRRALKDAANLHSFAEFLETKRVKGGARAGFFRDAVNQKAIFFAEADIEDIEKTHFSPAFLNILVENEPLKRLEEQLKFVLSRAEQSLIVEFLRESKQQSPEQIDKSLKTNRYRVEVEFYAKFFSEFAKAHRIPIEKFYFPRNKNKLVSNSHKTINKSYMGNITLNPAYVAKMTAFIRGRLLEAEKETIRTKINNKIEKWNSFLLRKINFEREDRVLEHFDEFISTNILDNDKFKLPWSVKQIESAISTVLEQLS